MSGVVVVTGAAKGIGRAICERLQKDDQTFVRSPKNAGKQQFAGMRWWMPRTAWMSSGIVRPSSGPFQPSRKPTNS